jgi:uncharacterized protein
MATNIDKLKVAYQAWSESRGESIPQWLDLVSDDFEIRSVAPEPPGLTFAGLHKGRGAFEGYLNSLLQLWRMDSYTVEAIFGDDDAVAMFGTCSYTFKATGKSATTPIANLWRFRDGKAYEFIEIFDSAKAMDAATPG